MRSPFMHFENPPLWDGLGDVRIPTPVHKGEGPGAPSSWFRELTGIAATRRGKFYLAAARSFRTETVSHYWTEARVK
jgi:hypothetical protein